LAAEPIAKAFSARETAFAALNMIVTFSMIAGWVWLTLLISEYFFQSMLARVISVATILPLSSRFILPWVALLTVPLVIVLALPLNLIFPLKEEQYRPDNRE
jgi:hypothetical protein